MATAAGDRLAGILGGEPAARQLIQLGRPAQFGRGEETLTDREVRDTWEIPEKSRALDW
jgi:hypothetical protein